MLNLARKTLPQEAQMTRIIGSLKPATRIGPEMAREGTGLGREGHRNRSVMRVLRAKCLQVDYTTAQKEERVSGC